MNARIPVAVPMARPIAPVIPPLRQSFPAPAAPPAPMSSVGPPQPPVVPPSVLVAAAQPAADALEVIKKFVHPDHRHILERCDDDTPFPPVKPVPIPNALNYDEARRQVQSVMPHYGLCGEILAVTPSELRKGCAVPFTVRPFVSGRAAIPPLATVVQAVQPPPPPADQVPPGSTVQIMSKNDKSVIAVQDLACDVSETHRKPVPATSDELDAPPPPIRQKRKRALAPVPPAVFADRVCATPGCTRTIPPKFQGILCVQCGFTRWQSQFRERFATVHTELSARDGKGKENKAPVPTKEPISATVVDAANSSVVGDGAELGAVAAPHKVDVAGSKVDSIPPPSQAISHPLPHSVEMPQQQTQPAAQQPDAMDVDSDSSDDQPLSAMSRRASSNVAKEQSAMDVDPVTSDEPLSAMATHNNNVTSDEESLSAMLQDYASSDEEPLAKVVPARRAVSPQKLSATHAASGTTSTTYAPLRIVIPPLSNPAPPRIRRVRLILGPRPTTPESDSASSRESSPERSSPEPSHQRRRTSSAIDERWLALGWDSDESELTPLEESTDEGESEIDPAESEDEAPVPVAADPSTDVTPLKSRSPAGRKHRGQCATPQCGNLLLPGWKWKNCDICRLRTRILRKQQRRAAAVQVPKELEVFEVSLSPPFGSWVALRGLLVHSFLPTATCRAGASARGRGASA